MNSGRQRRNWTLDALLLGGFLLAMLLDLTDLVVHQWLGLAIPALAIYHLARHWQWVTAVSRRFFGNTSSSARRNYEIDAALLISLVAIAATGLVISTWFDLKLSSYSAWLMVHIAVSLTALALLVVKIGLHWRWIVLTARRYVFPGPGQEGMASGLQRQAGALQPAPVPARVSRRDFLALMATVGAASLLGGTKALGGIASAASSTPDSTSSESTTTTAAASASTASSCTIACPRRCSYPGNCRRYVDSNGNRLCDLGECGSGGSAAGGFSGEGSGQYGGPRPDFRRRKGRG